MEIFKFIFIIFEVLLLFNLLIIVHELGHFLAARWRGLRIEKFGVWFGKPLWEREYNGVKYSLGSIPAGGFVALPQMAPMEALEGKNESGYKDLPPISALDKIIVAFAGPLFSFGLAILFAGIVWVFGKPVSETDMTTVIGYVLPDSPAEEAGLKAGDRILEIDGGPVERWSGIGDAVTWRIVSSEGETIPIKVERDGKILDVEANPIRDESEVWERKPLRQIKILYYQTPLVAAVQDFSPAAEAGIKENDVIRAVNGERIYNPQALSAYIRANPESTLNLEIERAGKPVSVVVKPALPDYPEDYPDTLERVAMIGVVWDLNGKMTITRPSPLQQVQDSVMAMVKTFGALFSSKSDIGAQHLSGPVGIMRIYYLLFESDFGWRLALWFSVLFNVNLAILNLLPIPVLDGGHIVLALIEAAFKKPIPYWMLNVVQTACAVFVIGFMLYVTFFDVQDLPWKRQKSYEIKFAPKPAAEAPAQPPNG